MSIPSTVQMLPPGHHLRVTKDRNATSAKAEFSPTPFVAIDPSFLSILSDDPSIRCLAKSDNSSSFAHEAGVWVDSLNEVWFTSNLIQDTAATSSGTLTRMRVEISAVNVTTGKVRLVETPGIKAGNGACPYGDFILFCDQGGDEKNPSRLTIIDPNDPSRTEILVDNFYGRQFNSLNDVVVLPPPETLVDLNGEDTPATLRTLPIGTTVWFTDPPYGFEQSFRPPCQLPPHVYALDPHTGHIRVVADGFDHPNGICFSPDGKVCYITDTSHIHGSGRLNPALQSTIYAFDVVWLGTASRAGGSSLQNRRVFAFADSGVPDGIKCDHEGNLYAGCGDGIHVWNKYGTLVGKMLLGHADGNSGAGCANFCFIPGGKLVCFSEDRIYLVEGLAVKGALLGN